MFKNPFNGIFSLVCEYKKTCKHYSENSHQCNNEPENCGIFRGIRRGIIAENGDDKL